MKITDDGLRIECDTLAVNSLEANSGIFIGNNHSFYWSSHNKVNNGLGTINSCDISKVLNIVYDNDFIDTFINDHENETEPTYYTEKTPEGNNEFSVNTINVNAINNNSTLSMGENKQNSWRSHHKSNFGIGHLMGVNNVSDTLNNIEDNDFLDTQIKP
ncbi:hypothetical protein JOD43_000526 [Pullulanibacillus pueri]|uniref:Uncharacterized protein n=1 Tax=Pullulanibacillus pueri TaxID=1437324 RepID=A0A8J3EL85_9BACL|nr:hypothetical protein [Pullulanibacillus pueri]MBM7680367.1 hypothetical protein [Pullulanibacillus pueri]GGH75425.1 hypothetical protein GCM10007096_04640 [Pullulanibacillus pueri]